MILFPTRGPYKGCDPCYTHFSEYWRVVGWLGWAVGWLGGCAVGWLGCRVCVLALQNSFFCIAEFRFSALQNSVFCTAEFCVLCVSPDTFASMPNSALQNFRFLHCRFSVFCIAKVLLSMYTQSRRWQHDLVLRFLDGWMLPGQLAVRWLSFAATCSPPKTLQKIRPLTPH